MANRREFLQATLAASALAAIPLSALAEAAKSLPVHTVLFDQRFADSVLFAAEFAGQGIATYGMPKGDITPFWRNELSTVWAETPASIAGLTDESALFCLEQLGRQHGLRVLHREAQPSGLVAWVVAPRNA